MAVLNGTDTTGKARAVAGQLSEFGFRITATGNAPEPVGRSTLTYPEGLAGPARALAERIPGLDPTVSDRAAPGTVTLTIGPDLPVLRG